MTAETPKVGDWVEVKSKAEILATLDHEGRLDGMPFMPEMLDFCGRRFQVQKNAHKTCDTVFPVRSRRLQDTVHLETRCDGRAHGGCQAACLLFWKTSWLRRVDASVYEHALPGGNACSEDDLLRAVRSPDSADDSDPAFVCQATRLPYASLPLSPFDVRQYVQDYTSGNVGLGQWLRGIVYITYQNLINLGIGLGPALRWLYDTFQRMWGGLPYPRLLGKIPMGQSTPAGDLNLQEGELVRVKSYQEILETCNVDNKNRGMGFDAEQVPYCGGTYRVKRRVTRILNEKTGKMMHMKNPCIVLEGVVCQGRYSECRMFCARAIYSYWREIWLERVDVDEGHVAARADGAAGVG